MGALGRYDHSNSAGRVLTFTVLSLICRCPLLQHYEFWADDPSVPGNQDIRHPYVHQIFAITVSFLLTYRSQLAYQRFWEGRTNLQMMSARWKDAALQLFIFV